MNIQHFAQDESGAVTVDWVVLTAAIVGLGIATYGVVSGGIKSLSGDVDTHLRTDWIDTAFGAATWAYSPKNQEMWDVRMAELRADYSGAPRDKMVNLMRYLLDGDAVRPGQEDLYVAYQIVMEENGDSLPDGMPDMRDL